MIEIVDRETGELLDADSVPGLAEIAVRHHERLDQLGEQVAELMEADSGGSGPKQRPVIWHELDPHTRRKTWTALAGWVGWLRGRYPLAHRVPSCWWRHTELVEELTALWLAWCEAYVEKDAALGAGADWRGRSLPEFLPTDRGRGLEPRL